MNAVVQQITQDAPTQKRVSLIARLAEKFHVEPSNMLNTLKQTAFKGNVSNEQMMALLVVADQYGLNPWTKEVYAFPDKNNGIVPVVGVDGWSRIMNKHEQFDGMEFEQDDASCTCIIYRKDRNRPVRVTEYMKECSRATGPWSSHPKRMLRHKAMIQCARLAFGFVGIYDQDEAERIVEGDARVISSESEELNSMIEGKSKASAETVEFKESSSATYAQLEEKLNASKDDGEGSLILDMAKHLPADQQADLLKSFKAKFEKS
jgi:phage recombination protein Bet